MSEYILQRMQQEQEATLQAMMSLQKRLMELEELVDQLQNASETRSASS